MGYLRDECLEGRNDVLIIHFGTNVISTVDA